MDHLSYKTLSVNKAAANKGWVVIDAGDSTLGRVASQIAMILRGKNKPSFTPNADCGDNVVVINADKVRMTGKKWDKKTFVTHTGYPGGQRTFTPRELKAKSSTLLVERAVKGMLPKSRLGREQFRNLFVYPGAEHPHAAQQPVQVKLTK
ncbi:MULTISPECIES: 50S ribosomal protein L13 [Rufibacter]|uniref:Large ribosomal subunit protein uL13 n=1 Tax=Rufibacter quisquiliarum TaxID=1549639 RepID=A0A839GS61_9BACT|nr:MULTISPECIES: 50S ribosomal protein L13 [Rufibacter]MBA9079699.1 large subunit ribosomal protein L13 [Rufibacter quisquiliarum]